METNATDRLYMSRCIELAKNGFNGAPPNPMVGAVIVAKGRIIGEGYHVHCGKGHAEVNAIASVKPADRHLLSDSTIYVSLEPCSHYGKTPPCAKLIIETGIPRVVVGCIDPFAKVSGRGVAMLRQAGIEVKVGVMEEECRRLNKRFITFNTLGRPYITLKWASSADGYLDTVRSDGKPALLSTPMTLMEMHRRRSQNAAILVGHNTLRLDRPALTVRHWTGNTPLRLVLGRVEEGELPSGFEAFADIPTLLSSLYSRNIQTLMVEGGRHTLQSFIDAGLWDEAWEEHSALVLGSGVPSPQMPAGTMLQCEEHWGVAYSHFTNPAPKSACLNIP